MKKKELYFYEKCNANAFVKLKNDKIDVYFIHLINDKRLGFDVGISVVNRRNKYKQDWVLNITPSGRKVRVWRERRKRSLKD